MNPVDDGITRLYNEDGTLAGYAFEPKEELKQAMKAWLVPNLVPKNGVNVSFTSNWGLYVPATPTTKEAIPVDVTEEFRSRYEVHDLILRNVGLYKRHHDWSCLSWKVDEYRYSLPELKDGFRRDIYFAQPTGFPYTVFFTHRDVEVVE